MPPLNVVGWLGDPVFLALISATVTSVAVAFYFDSFSKRTYLLAEISITAKM